MLDAVSDAGCLQAMLDVEAAIARAEARVGLIPVDAAEEIASSCDAGRFDLEQLGRDAVGAGNPVIPLVRALTAAVPEDAAGYVHWGATSQDVLDTALMLLAKRGLELIDADLGAVAGACATLADEHRSTIMAGRTLLQQALPITFGLKAAGWLTATMDARRRLVEVRTGRLAVQFGGAAGTLAALGARGLLVSGALSAELGLVDPPLPWHTARGRIAELGEALGLAAGTMGKVALDVALMTQTEVGEVSEASGPGRGGSSTLPQKRNPVGASAVRACVLGVNAQAGTLLAAMAQEHERAAGAWQAEWGAIPEALRLTSGAVARTRELLDGLDVHIDRMGRNLLQTGGLLMSEHVMMVLAQRTGRQRAHQLVRAAADESARSGRDFRELLMADSAITQHLTPAELDAALEPAAYLGAAEALIERALTAYERDRPRGD
jgi:3-carboxy-cis,cis-muconate cycloisomerase